MPTSSERDCIDLTLKGQRNAFRTIVELHYLRVFRFLKTMVREEAQAEDLCQETFIRAYEKLELFDSTRSFGPWVMRIAYTTGLKFIQKKRKEMVTHLNAEFEKNWSNFGNQQPEDDRIFLDQCIENLPEGLKLIFLLKHALEFTYDELSEILEEPVGTLKTKVSRACINIRESLNKQPGRNGNE